MKFNTMKAAVLAGLLAMVSVTAYAGDNFVEVGADAMFYDDFSEATNLDTNVALNARWGTLGETGLYAWGSYEQPDVKFDGYKVSKVKTWGVGGGLRVPFESGVYVFTELGYYFPGSGKGVDVNYNGDLGGAIGVGYDISSNWTVNTKYRILKIDAKNGENTVKADMSAMTIGLSYRF
jgi:opacity protein-like surface antigen